jgi:microcystin-dependent protein
MADPFLAEIRMFSFNFAPQGWAMCNGQLLPINQNQGLFALLGITYGGNGQTNFALPDLRGRVPIHEGAGFNLGQTGGEDAHTLSISELPAHAHTLNAVAPNDSSGNTNIPTGAYFSNTAPAEVYNSGAGNPVVLTPLPATVANTGGSQPHLNQPPFLTINFSIALIGLFPAQN